MPTWVGTYQVSDVITHLDSPYLARNGELILFDSSGGAVTVLAPASPIRDTSFRVQAINAIGFDITVDGNGKDIRDVFGDGAQAPTFTGFDAYGAVTMFFDDTIWDATGTSPATVAMRFSSDVHTAGTVVANAFNLHRYEPSAGIMVIEAPINPYPRMRWGIVNVGPDVTPITISGNGSNLHDSSFNLVASFVSTAPNARAVWEYDGADWILIDQGGGLLTGVGNQASISRPFNGTSDVNYGAGFQKVEQFTAESSGTGLAADFANNQITINKQGLFRLEAQSTIAGKTGSRTDLSISLDGTPTEDRWVSQGTGLTEPVTFQPTISELAVSSPPVVVTLEVSSDASGNKTIRHYGLRLSIMEL